MIELASILSFSAIKNNDKVGLLLFSDQIEKFIPPQKGKWHVLRVIREMIYHKANDQQTDISTALEHIQKVLKRKSIIFLISDFWDESYQQAIKLIHKKHDLINIQVLDKAEFIIQDVGMIKLHDVENQSSTWIDTNNTQLLKHISHHARLNNLVLYDFCRKNRILLAMDEVQAGMGRSGRLFAFEHYGIVPDLITCGKGLSSSLPVSAVKGRKELMDLPGASMSSTFGGNPVCAAAALACLDVIEEEKLVERSKTLGDKLGKELEAIADRHRRYINWVDGRGLFRSIHIKDPVTGEQVPDLVNEMTMACIRRGVMLFHTSRFFKIVPPLIIEEDALFEAIGVISDVFDDYLK